MIKAGLVLEGGAARGTFTAGALDFLMEKEVEFAYVTGVSAGSCNATNFVAKQKGRMKKCMIIEEKEKEYMYIKKTLGTGSLYDMDMLFEKFPNEIFPFDFDTYFSSGTETELVVTNCETGKAEYLSEKTDGQRLMQLCRASSSLPFMAPMVEIDGCHYFDGGLSDSVPISHTLRKGYKKCVVILTRRKGYRKVRSWKLEKLYIAAFRKYPKLVNTMIHRPEVYNKQMELIDRLEAEGRIFVLRPEISEVKHTEQNVQVLTEFYEHGYEMMESRYEELREYLGLSEGQ